MSRWRKVDVRLWGDERVRKLSRPPASALVCWIYLLTARESTSLPGAIHGGAAALAESLSWTRAAFLRCFGEIVAQGMAKADWSAGLVWLPNALRYNEPQSPNVVKAWARAWEELPDCDLKEEIHLFTEAFLEAKGEAFREAFAKGTPQPFREPERKRKQETEAEIEPAPRKPRSPSDQQAFAAYFEERRRVALAEAWTEDTTLAAQRLNAELAWVKDSEDALVAEAVAIYLQDPRRRDQDPPCSLLWFSKDRAGYLSKARRRGAA